MVKLPAKILIVFLTCFFVACQNEHSKQVEEDFEIPDSVVDEQPIEFSDDALGEIIQNFSSPVEMAALIKNVGVPFSRDLLCPTENPDAYDTDFKRALALGMYGVDLGYLNIYNRTSSVVNYITVIKKLANGMKVGQFFEYETLKRLASTEQNLDSLMYVSQHSFNRMDSYLRNNGRNNLSSLIVSGVWIEGLYLATQVIKEAENDKIRERIGEQKIVLGDIIILLKQYSDDKRFAGLVEEMEAIKQAYKDVKIYYEVGESEAIEQNGKLIIVQNETSHVKITDEQLKNIITKTEELRNKLIGL